jgi:hypothetical protein
MIMERTSNMHLRRGESRDVADELGNRRIRRALVSPFRGDAAAPTSARAAANSALAS